MSAMTYEQALPFIEQGYHFHATEAGLVRFTEAEEAEWAARPPPEAPRRLIPKSIVQERCAVIGKLDELMTALLANPLYFGRWFAPNHPNVYADDPDLLAMLGAVGCTPEQIAEVTAP